MVQSETETFVFKSEMTPMPFLNFLETETFEFGSESKTKTKTETFFETCRNCRPRCFFKATTTMTCSIHALILHNWNNHKNSWHYQEFTHHIFSNLIGQLLFTSTAPKL